MVRYEKEMPANVKIGVGRRVFLVPIWAKTTAFCQQESFCEGGEGNGGGTGRKKETSEKMRDRYAQGRNVTKGRFAGDAGCNTGVNEGM